NCITPTIVIANPDQSCANVSAGSLIGSTPSIEQNNCGGTQTNDAWFQFIATSPNHSISLINVVGNVFNLNYVLYSGTNCNSLTEIACETDSQGIISNINVGETYTIRVFLSSFTTNSNITFNVCVGTIPPSISSNSTQFTEQQLVQNVLLNSTCASVSNITYSTGTTFGTNFNGIGYFNRNNSTFPFSDGIVLSTGIAAIVNGPNTNVLSNGTGGAGLWAGDNDLNTVINNAGIVFNSNNATKLEFDFTPITSNISFEYIFASEEYGIFQCSFSDSFAFLLTDSVTGVTTNLAVIPGTNTPISVYSVRDSAYNTACSTENINYFGQYNLLPGLNPLNSPINFNGQTKPLVASSNVVINRPYHIKLVIADNNDGAYDSAVFLKGSSFGIGNLNIGSNLLQSTNNALCDGEIQVLNSQLDALLYSFVWLKDGVIIAGENGATLTINSAGTYIVQVTYIGSNCTGTDSVIVEYYPKVIPSNPNNLSKNCNPSGTDVFNLTENNITLLTGFTTGYTVKYYLNNTDANNDTNAISNPTSYTNISNPQNICARVQNTLSGCFGVKCFNLIVQDLTPQFFLPNTLTLCNSISQQISLTPINFSLSNVALTWKKDNVVLTDITSSISINQAGTYEVTVNNSGCTTTKTTTVSNVIVVADTNLPINVCANYKLPILSLNNNYYSGANGSGTAYFAGDVITSSILPMYIKAQIGTCVDETNFNIVIKPNVTPVTTFSYISPLCKGNANTFPSKSTGFVEGGTFSSTPNLDINSTTGLINLTNSLAGTYQITYTILSDAINCVLTNSHTFEVKINEIVTPTFNPIIICQNSELVLPTSSNNNPPIIGTWNSSALTTTISGTINKAVFTPNAGQCAINGTVTIRVDAIPVFEIIGNCQSSAFNLQVNPELSGANYQWFQGNSIIPFNTSDSKIIINEIGLYKCIATVNNCSTTVNYSASDIQCEIQKGISPNSDGKNDYFDLATLNVKQLGIYNRFGLMVYNLANYKNEWNGKTDDNKILPDGTYYYVAELGDGNTKTGWVYINKEIK
uniref:choice-of-anchor L domain-containing protein n=1 Tax=Flavobacterium sp. TaxID=239 RepID=UPI00374FE442